MKSLISPVKLLRLHNRMFTLRTPSKYAWTLAFSDDQRGKEPLISLRVEKTRFPLLAIVLPFAALLVAVAVRMPRGK